MKRYELTIEHYNDYRCLMFTAMDALYADKGFENTRYGALNRLFPSWYWKSLPATLSTNFFTLRGEHDSLTRERIADCTNCIINKVNGKQQSSDDCHDKILEALRAMNQHLRRFEYWWLIQWGFAVIAWFRSLRVREKCIN
jgi:hypothetical protein